MRLGKQIFWLVILLISSYFIYNVRGILPPFIFAFIIAYFLHPLVSKLEKYRIPRWLSSALVILIFVLVIIILFVKLLPLIYEQLGEFISSLPAYREYLHQKLILPIINFVGTLDHKIKDKFEAGINDFSSMIFVYITDFLNNIWQSGMAIMHVASLIFLTPILVFYVLRDWHKIVKSFEKTFPRSNRTQIKHQMREIEKVLSGFVRGQFTVCLFLGVFYALSLYFTGLKYALTIGFVTGILSFIPYLGIFLGSTVAIFIAFIQFNNIREIAVVILVLVVGQIIESNFISPRIVGEKVGLHPVWLLFAVLAGGYLFGFVGVMLAVPVAAVIGVIWKSLMRLYLSSSFYR